MSVYAQEGTSSGGSVYSQPVVGGGSVYSGASGAPASGGNNVAGNLVGDIVQTAKGFVPGIARLGESAYHDAGAILHGHTPTSVYNNILVPVGHSYADTYGPLIHGHISEFLHGVKEHPLGPILDVATLFTAGAGGVARAGTLLAEHDLIDAESTLARLGRPDQIELRSPGARAGQASGKVLPKPTSRNPAVRVRQEAVDALLKKTPYNKVGKYRNPVGELARYGREAKRQGEQGALKLQASTAYKDFAKAAYGLSKKEHLATGILARVPLPAHLDAWKQIVAEQAGKGDRLAQETLDILNDPKVNELYLNPTAKMMRAHEAADRLGKLFAQALDERGALPAELSDVARLRHSRIAAGGIVYTPKSARAAVRRIDTQIRTLDRHGERVQQILSTLKEKRSPEIQQIRKRENKTIVAEDRLNTGTRLRTEAAGREQKQRAALDAELRKLEQAPDAAGAARVSVLAERYDRALNDLYQRETRALPNPETLTAERADTARAYQEARTELAARLTAGRQELERVAAVKDTLATERADIRPGIVGADPEAIAKQIADAGRPQPIYLPDVAREPQVGIGERVLGGPRDAKVGDIGQAADKTVAAAASPVNQSVGYLFTLGHLALEPDVLSPEFLRVVKFSLYRDLHNELLEAAVRIPRGGRLPTGYVWVRRPASLQGKSLEELVADPARAEESRLAERGLTSSTDSEALSQAGFKYAVPETLARQMSGEFRHASNTIANFLNRPLQVWRALVLNLRVGWLVNNVVGNHFLYALQNAGPSGVRAYLNMIGSTKGGAFVRRMVGLGDPDGIGHEFLAEHFPEQSGGTFIGSQLPTGGGAGKVNRAVRRAHIGLAPADKAVEGNLRRAATEAELRKLPEVRRIQRQMPKDTRTFEAAAKQALDENPLLAREVSDRVNATLGDFLNLSDFERRVVRNYVPFWAWYRAITKVALKLPLDQPGRALILQKLSQIGEEQLQEAFGGPVPDFLKGAVPLGGGDGSLVPVLNLTSANPLSTVGDVARVASALVGAKPGAAGSTVGSALNPFAQSLIEWLTGKNLFTGGDLKGGRVNGIPGVVWQNLSSLPQAKLIEQAAAGTTPSPLYGQRTPIDVLLSQLGVPLKNVNPARARALANEGK